MKIFFTVSAFLLLTVYGHAQLVVDSASTTPSVCYNDGTLRLYVSGGTGTYQYVITDGPVLLNITYPIYPDNGSSFLSLHSGTYTVQITDNGGDTLHYTVTIPGNYEFPVLTDAVYTDSIFVYPSLGLPPYSFAISTVSPNGPFGAYQSSNLFDSLCNGTYYVRVLDSCGNFYTTAGIVINQLPVAGYTLCSVTGGITNIRVVVPGIFGNPPFTFINVNGSYADTNSTGIFAVPSLCPDTVYILDICNDTAILYVDCNPFLPPDFCSNFSDSTATIIPYGGSAPYTYRYYEWDALNQLWILILTQDSAHFTHLPYSDNRVKVKFEVTDACGRVTAGTDVYLTFGVYNSCPFTGDVAIIPSDGILSPDSAVITCVSCSPQQTWNFSQHPYFTNLDTGAYTFRFTDGCGETRDRIFYIPDTIGVEIGLTLDFISCNDVQITAHSSDSAVLTTGVTFTLHHDTGYDSITTNSTGTYHNLPSGNYIVVAHYGICIDVSYGFFIPGLTGYCIAPYFDSICGLNLTVNYSSPDMAENYSLISGSGIIYNESPPGAGNGISFDIPPGTYNLVSDSGCSVQSDFSFNFEMVETHYTNCINRGTITLSPRSANSSLCPNPTRYTYTIQNSDTILEDQPLWDDSAVFKNLAPDTFIARAHLTGFPNCALDSFIIIILPHDVPFIITQNVQVCDSTDLADIPFVISGGVAPYYISIAGYPGITTDSSSGVLPGIPLGNYTMIVNDFCGISRSVSVSVIDTCIACDTIQADFTVSDSTICKGDTVFFQNVYSGGIYLWTINGVVFDSIPNTSLIIDSAGDKFIRCIVRRYGCLDTFSAVIHVLETPEFELGDDIFFCDDSVLTLSSGISSTQWSNGVVDSFITVSAPGLYRAEVTGLCGTFMDSVEIFQQFSPVIDLGSDTILCTGDSLILHARTDSATYLWSNGSAGDSIIIQQAGEYSVTVSLAGCTAFDIISFQEITVDRNILTGDTVICPGTVLVLTPAAGTNPVWHDGSHKPEYQVSDSGLYIVTVSSPCGNISDSVKIEFTLCESSLHIPGAFTPNGDGVNDHFTVFGDNIAEYDIRIFNRWGELVYSSADASELNDLSRGWDGSYKGKMQTTATFVYTVHAKGEEGRTLVEKGNLTLIR